MTIEISNLSLFAIIAIACVAVALIVMHIIKYRGRKDFERLTTTLAEKSDIARKELKVLFVPSHFIEEAQINDFKSKYADLV